MCSTNQLDNPIVADFVQGQTDVFECDKILGRCNEELFKPYLDWLTISLSSSGNDAWLMEFAIIFFTDNSYWRCDNSEEKWLTKLESYNVTCEKISDGRKYFQMWISVKTFLWKNFKKI